MPLFRSREFLNVIAIDLHGDPNRPMGNWQFAMRRDSALMLVLATAMLGVIGLFMLLGWLLWRESVVAEEQRLGELAQRLGLQAENAIIDARELLETLNQSQAPRCSPKHVQRMQEEAIGRPWIRAIGYWRAIERQCGAGFVQGTALTPPAASRIYDSGVVAWWPSPETAVGGVQLFLMRFGDHDVAIDPRLLLDGNRLEGQQAGLWVEGLPMVSMPPGAQLPEPQSLAPGLTIDRAGGRIASRFSLGTVLPMDVVAVQPSGQFVARYLPSLVSAALMGLALIALWVIFMFRLSRRQLSLATELRTAIDTGTIEVVYQPIVDLDSGRCQGAEALARWRRDNGEAISPEVFIPMAEEAGLVTRLTLALLRKVLRQLGDTLRARSDLSINLNLSPLDLENPDLPQLLAATLAEAGLPASAIKLEITERSLIDHEDSRQLISELRQRGHQVAIDDFGTGYSSLSYLESFELDTLKLDKAFVDAIETHAVTSSVIVHIIEMAKSLNLDMVAEGIESAHQAHWLAERGVQRGQGYLYSPPMDAAEFIAFEQQPAHRHPQRLT